jgi:hypothetical protein
VTVCDNSVKLLLCDKKLSPEGCEIIMPEIYNDIDIEMIEKTPETTPYAGALPFMKMCEGMGLPEVINNNLNIRGEKGYKDSDHVLSMAMLQILGGSTVDDLATLKQNLQTTASPFQIPSPTAARDYMSHFHDAEEAGKQKQGRSYIPQMNEHLAGFDAVHTHIFHQAYKFAPVESITLDQDATFIPTSNKNALFNYQGEKAYEAFNTYCPEYDLVVGTQLRDGNVNPGYGQFEELRRVLSTIPEGVKKVTLRSDTAGYQDDVLRYCAEGKDERFGEIGFTISCKIVDSFRHAAQVVPEGDWKPVLKEVKKNGVTEQKATGQEWAEVAYVPDWSLKSKAEYRFIAVRERTELRKGDNPAQMSLPEMIEDMEKENEHTQRLHITAMKNLAYKVFGIVTNLSEEDGGKIVLFHHERCGKSEEVHLILKEELGGGHVASGKFGCEAAWWNIAVLSLSLLNLFKCNFLPPESHALRPKAMRYRFFVMVGRFVRHARKMVLKIYSTSEQVIAWYRHARDRLMGFCAAAS